MVLFLAPWNCGGTMEKIFRHFYITGSMKETIEQLVEENGWTITSFTEKALDLFLSGKKEIDLRFLVKKKTDPNYIKRNVRTQAWIRKDQFEELQKVAEQKGCNYVVVIFQAYYDFCLLLLSSL